jgi:thiamine-phosphate pyrophosphorylase
MPPRELVRQRLILWVPGDTAPAPLAAALAAGDVAAAVIGGRSAAAAPLVEAAQAAGAAALVAHAAGRDKAPAWPVPFGADGLHLSGDAAAAERVLLARPEGASVGAEAHARHTAMLLGEAGADYVWFGSTAQLDVEPLEHACWWQALFEVPAVAAGPPGAVPALIATRVEFIAVNVFDADDPAALVAAINAELDRADGVR